MIRQSLFAGLLVTLITLTGSGCGASRIQVLEKENIMLKKELALFEAESRGKSKTIDSLKDKLEALEAEKAKEILKLESVKKELETSLKDEIDTYKAKLEMTERGLVLTFLAEIFFDSGKADIRPAALDTIKSVSSILKNKVSDFDIVIEGHTDNEPITHSGWKSNWELGSHRTLSVLHYFEREGGIPPESLSSSSYGEYKPVADNATPEGRQKNRRVEIIIAPPAQMKIKKLMGRE